MFQPPLEFANLPEYLGNFMEHAESSIKLMHSIGDFFQQMDSLNREYCVNISKLCSKKKKEIKKLSQIIPAFSKHTPYTTWLTFFDKTIDDSKTYAQLGKDIGIIASDMKKDISDHEQQLERIRQNLEAAQSFVVAIDTIQKSKLEAEKKMFDFAETKRSIGYGGVDKKEKQKIWLKCFTETSQVIKKYKLDLLEGNKTTGKVRTFMKPMLNDLQYEEVSQQITLKKHIRRWVKVHQDVIRKHKRDGIYNTLMKMESNVCPRYNVESLIKTCQETDRHHSPSYSGAQILLEVDENIKSVFKASLSERYNIHWFGYELTTPADLWMATQHISNNAELFNSTLEEVSKFQSNYSSSLVNDIEVPLIVNAISKEIKDKVPDAFKLKDLKSDPWELQWYREQFECGNYKAKAPSPKAAAGLFLIWLDELPEPLIPTKWHRACYDITVDLHNKEEQYDLLQHVMRHIPKKNRNLINRILDFIREGEEKKENKIEQKSDQKTQLEITPDDDPANRNDLCNLFFPFMFKHVETKDKEKENRQKQWLSLLVESDISEASQNINMTKGQCNVDKCKEPSFKDQECVEHTNFWSGKEESSQGNKKEDKRKRIIAEILETEVKYVKSLTLLNDYWVTPLTKEEKNLKLTSDQLKALRSNIGQIEGFQKMFLGELQKKEDADAKAIAEVFTQYASFFKFYIDYLKNYELLMNTISKLQLKNKKFEKWFQSHEKTIKKRSKKEFNQEEALMSHLIKPVQRVPRYVLLLRELLKYTEKGNPSYDLLSESLKNVQTVAAKINTAKRRVENISHVFEILSSMKGYQGEPLVKAQRFLIREGKDIGVSEVAGVTSKAMNVYLFSDLILWLHPKGKDLIYKGKFHLDNACLFLLQSQEIQINTETDLLYLKMNNADDRKKWIDDIKLTILAHRRNNQRFQKEKKSNLAVTNSSGSNNRRGSIGISFRKSIKANPEQKALINRVSQTTSTTITTDTSPTANIDNSVSSITTSIVTPTKTMHTGPASAPARLFAISLDNTAAVTPKTLETPTMDILNKEIGDLGCFCSNCKTTTTATNTFPTLWTVNIRES